MKADGSSDIAVAESQQTTVQSSRVIGALELFRRG